MGGDCLADRFDFQFLFGNLPDVQGFVIADVETLPDLDDHVLHGDLLHRGSPAACPATIIFPHSPTVINPHSEG